MAVDYTMRRRDKRPIHVIISDAMAECSVDAGAADVLWRSWCTYRMPRVPGCDTIQRLAVRLWCGRSITDAAKEEYLYRWRLALQSKTFGVPHTLGM